MASEHTPDLVLMDIQLPDLDGVASAASTARGRAHGDDPGPRPDRTSDAWGSRAVPGGGLRRLRVEARERTGADRDRSAALRGTTRMSGDARILVVDDVAPNVRLLEAVLVPRGYDVVSATDGARALELVASAKPDLVMLDVVMPQPDGYAVCRAIREREDTAMLPVIMITASTSERTEAIRAGADDLIAKPFDQDELLARVRSLLRIKRYHDTITSQAAELTELNRTLEERVRDPGRGAREGSEAPAVPLSAARRRDRHGRRRRDPPQPSPQGRDALRRPPRMDQLRRHGRA